MAPQEALRGSCACGRNRYVVEIPQSDAQLAQVLFDNSSLTRRFQASPITAWLRVPLSWYQSTTFAFHPDETHTSIRHTFTSPFDSLSRRQFCGYCGTPLSSWTERTRQDADFISLTLESLLEDDVPTLEYLGLLPGSDESSEDEAEEPAELAEQEQEVRVIGRPLQYRGAPWFEEMIENSRLGRIKRHKGGHTSRDGSTTVEWEVVEYTAGDDDDLEVLKPAKRNIGDVEEVEDVEMKTART